MKVGNRVIISGNAIPKEIVGCRGIIIDEKIPESQMAMLCGIVNFVIKLDKPVVLKTSSFSEIRVPSHMLTLEKEAYI